MSFETAKRITPESFNQGFQFGRRPSVRYPVRQETKQSVNISKETRERAAHKNAPIPHIPRQAYGTNGKIDRGTLVGQFLSAMA
ncbi:hypothetical protein IEN85_18425 [Pelagicoccus sp. NFK12]|uniref:Uncharacterized protein n=1 Tax=Pelagicoccus enzymogenes TaxID=2773457 RepID=A0A927IJ70_9BACT|nr:hypothetical protein [Pelagicoccus enzymogenes]MBD5781483.1 hypothetical protein [Pelagicoccus enzymogenes]MDQ8199081.1 hypothetical protein [Pelagicoccus enzymogenes]